MLNQIILEGSNMEKLKSTLPNMLLSLTVICIVASAVLASVNQLTAGPIAASKAASLEAAVKKKDGELVGVAVESSTQKGFSGEIKVVVGFDVEGKLLNYSVQQHSETPGLGSKMQEWFRTDKNNQSVIGRTLTADGLKVTKDGGDVDAITAATISSRAFLDAINRAYSAYKSADMISAATSNNNEKGGNDHE